MAEISPLHAKRIVNEIRLQNGGITEEIRQKTPGEALVALDNALLIAGNSTQFLAEELYSTKTRFIFELIQNAEDNSYSRALARHEAPYLKFTLSHDTITIDSNEDGFNEANVRAICSVRQSTKAPTGGYIGSKGIGFKSVFAVSYKVHIQSGPFSFYLEHRAGDSGMGMITPHNQSHNDLPDNVTSRLTLFLTGPNDFEDRTRDFTEIPDPLMLFLSKLQSLSVSIQPREGPSSTTSYTRQESRLDLPVHLIKSFNDVVTDSLYHVKRQLVFDLPEDESRSGLRHAEVILAFPIDDSSRPIIGPQHVYSFLPLRQEGLNFLVQSDFITQANREGLRHSAWNDALREGVCNAFVDAVYFFSSQPSIQYDWLAYLPGPLVASPFWRQLREMIIDRLGRCRILLSRSGNLHCPGDLKRLSERHCDQHGQPLFDDLNPEMYLSPHYPWRDEYRDNLVSLGVKNISYRNLLLRLDPYLLGPRPRILGPALDHDWHTRVATLLMRAMNSSSVAIRSRIKQMRLIPLSDGSLSSTDTAQINFPDDTEGNAIPTDLGMRIVDRVALLNQARQSLFENLGVNHCDPKFVISHIRGKYNRPHRVLLDNSISHLRYLYRALARGEELDAKIFLMDHHETPIYCKFVTFGQEIVVDDIYFETPGEYGTKELAQKLMSGRREQGVPRFEMHFIHQSYLDAVPSDVRYNGKSWEEWLKDIAAVRHVPKFKKSARSNCLSRLFRHVIESQPELLIGLLKTYWSIYETEITPEIVEEITNVEVPCQGASGLVSLKDTYFPSAELRELCSRMTIADHFKLFLDIPTVGTAGTSTGWEFLDNFNVGMQPDLDFFRDAIEVVTEKLNPGQAKTGFFALYEELSTRFNNSSHHEIRDLFNKYLAIYIPADAVRPARSIFLNKCVWNGPRCLRTKYPLANYSEYSNNKNVKYLLRVILDVQNANTTTYINELKFHKNRSEVSLEDMCTIYEKIAELKQTDDSWIRIRNKFEQHSLVYVPSERSWYQPKACVWASAPKIGTQFGIRAAYARLENFFLQGLSIQSPTTGNYVEQLKILSQERSPNIPDIKTAIGNINQMFRTNTELNGIQYLKCLPVRMTNGNTKLESVESQFFIADRTEYGSIFQDKVPILDYSLEEIHTLDPFLKALGLENRFMSSIIEEITTVQHQDSEPSTSLTRTFRRKSKHFTRCAIHYGGNRVRDRAAEILVAFQNASVYKSEGFKRTLKLSQGGLIATAESDSGLIHLEEVEESLRLFVPRGPGAQSRSYAAQLPKVLLRYLHISNPIATISLRNVILTSIDDIDAVLDTDGIVPLPDTVTSDLESNTSEGLDNDEHTPDSLTSTHTFSGDQTGPPHRTRYVATNSIQNDVLYSAERPASAATDVSEPRYEPRPFSPLAPHQAPNFHPINDIPSISESSYRRVLEKVIEVARRTIFPLEGLNLDVTALRSTNGNSLEGSPFGIRAQNPIAHDMKIGAAGELYVFELLLKLGLPDFGRSNWKSTIRDRVNIHPEYSDLAAWNGSETADIVYNDTNSVLTRLLITEGVLPRGPWETACPEYFMEVKSTIGTCETQFYMSKSQYTRMQLMEIQTNPPTNPKIYIIFRVYKLGTDDIRVKIYVDPDTSRQQRTLEFTPDSYTVTPARPLW